MIGNIKHAYYSWNNEHYQEFMVDILNKLETVRLKKNEIIYHELQDVTMVFFIGDGSIDLGYDINRVTKYVTRMQGNIRIGAYECSYNKRSQLIYRSSRNSDFCHFIRKKKWMQIETQNPGFYLMMRRKSLDFYNQHIRRKINNSKNITMDKFMRRADY